MLHRRRLLEAGLAGAAWPLARAEAANPDYATLDRALNAPVFRRELFPEPVILASVELLRDGNSFLCRVRSRDGAEGLSVGNAMQMQYLWPIAVGRVQPFFVGKDARDLDDLVRDVFVFRSNYKLQSLALWVPVATVEFAILDLLGRLAGRPLGELFGTVRRRQVAVYRANNYRGKTATESIARIRRNVERDGAQALKFKIGGRMSRNADDPPGRTEQLIPLVRETFGDSMVVYADSNGSYDVAEAIRIGRILEAHAIDFFEEPVPFDWYEGTRAVAEALRIPIAGGEQEASLRCFRWLIGHRALQIVQPDMFYFGGMIRSTRVARMAAALGCPCTPHISGSGLGYLYMMHFVSTLEKPGPYHEFKGFNAALPFACASSTLRSEQGMVTVPTGPGLGVTLDPAFVGRHRTVRL